MISAHFLEGAGPISWPRGFCWALAGVLSEKGFTCLVMFAILKAKTCVFCRTTKDDWEGNVMKKKVII